MFNFIGFIGIYLFLFIVIELLQKKVFTLTNWSRKATHISTGIVTFFLPDFFTISEIYIMSILFFGVLIISRWKKLLSLHKVNRVSYGEVIYPISVIILNFLFYPNNRVIDVL